MFLNNKMMNLVVLRYQQFGQRSNVMHINLGHEQKQTGDNVKKIP